ncbi:phm, putative ecdysteroid 25-hydroxylase, ecdysone biosynthesis [Daphnia pulex]|uniref:Phm, putative ecdysteroid 25-hydroxylase, ecdysone biosynthesis n=1 Tax=Daphnia pulex TaxID=6669 RepID=E9G4T9_DAPPU|nr:phm, putative ecdysteroid 25-hydroxylase, ecdysone biosynthesis [Daphnia pulex]|eukprot:EFX85499.1 phm, putative ecdysteroid 25-hydroxylase, ecdysone biosynthesis [Daphnia pulex]
MEEGVLEEEEARSVGVWAWLSLSSLLLGLLALLWLRFHSQQRNRQLLLLLPPGPSGLPWLGYLPWIDSRAPYETFAELSRRYGRIYSLKLGDMLAVFISDPQLVRQAFSRPVFSGRAPLYLTHGIMKGHGLICAEGESWREHRRFVMNVMKQLGMAGRRGASVMESRVMAGVLEFVHCQVTDGGVGGGVDLVPGLRHCIGNIINGVVFGRTYAADDPTWIWLQHLLDQGVKQVAVAGPINFLPVLRFLPSYRKIMSFILDGQAETHRHYQEIIDQRQLNLSANQGPDYTSVVEAYLLEMQRRQSAGIPPETFTTVQLHHVLADMFGAGTDTALTTIKWIVLYLILYPDVQERIHEEIERVVGQLDQGRIPCYATDARRMPWTEATICEVQRLKTILPLGVPHGTLQDCELAGYRIPKGAMVVPVWWAMNLDPTLWPEPLQFRPERFLEEEEEKWRVEKPEHFLPFQCGRRMCIGDDLGRTLIFLFTVTLLQHFRLSFPPQFTDYSATNFPQPDYGFTLVPHPYPVALHPR